MNESLTYPQTLALTDRLDYLGAHQNRHALCMCIEKAMGIEVSERVQYIRTIMDELQRIDSHLLFYSCLAMDLGALTAFFYGFRDREKILDIFEETCGGRLIMNYNTIGGVQADLHPNFVKRVKEFIPYMRGIIHEYHDIFTGNIIAQSRMKGVGVLSREDAIFSVVPEVQAVHQDGRVTYVNECHTVYMTKSISKKSFIRKVTALPVTWCVWMRSWKV